MDWGVALALLGSILVYITKIGLEYRGAMKNYHNLVIQSLFDKNEDNGKGTHQLTASINATVRRSIVPHERTVGAGI